MKRFLIGVAAMVFCPLLRAGVHLMIRPDGSKVIYNDEVDTRHYRPVEMSDSWLVARIARASRYDEAIARAAAEHDLDPSLVKSVMLVESGFNPRAVSRKGARGLMQLMPATARLYGVSDVFDAEQNIRGGTRYLTYLLNLYSGDLEQALAAYNAGEGAVQKYGGIPPYDETQLYVHKTLTAFYGRPYLSGGLGRASTSRYRRLPGDTDGRSVHVVRDAENNILLTTDSGRRSGARR